jgi:hypothetical protein
MGRRVYCMYHLLLSVFVLSESIHRVMQSVGQQGFGMLLQCVVVFIGAG